MKFMMAGALVVALATPCAAQQVSGYACSDFVHNADGSWSNQRPIDIQSVSVGTGEKLLAGELRGGLDMGALLNRQCAR